MNIKEEIKKVVQSIKDRKKDYELTFINIDEEIKKSEKFPKEKKLFELAKKHFEDDDEGDAFHIHFSKSILYYEKKNLMNVLKKIRNEKIVEENNETLKEIWINHTLKDEINLIIVQNKVNAMFEKRKWFKLGMLSFGSSKRVMALIEKEKEYLRVINIFPKEYKGVWGF